MKHMREPISVTVLLIALLLAMAVPALATTQQGSSFQKLDEMENVEKRLVEKELRDKRERDEERQRIESKILSTAEIHVSGALFNPSNESFKKYTGSGIEGYSLRLLYKNIFSIGMDAWDKTEITNAALSDISISGRAAIVAVTYPYALTDWAAIYAGGGGRFEQIQLNGKGANTTDITYGNNAVLVMVGAKVRLPNPLDESKLSFGLNFDYEKTFNANRTDYDIIKFGIFWGYQI